ncbi:glucosyltransferase-like protein [Actinidia rufa]|uniref:Glucosyltransferase-like protein n=1 Tax=Actinidia rufa TaxID=165716 RepID=A0A7J0G9Y5_9ERIC|nr:glucosyltransferase-like protein [Actinidia rufa]
MMKKRAEWVFVPAPGMGHLVPMVEFGKHLLDRVERLSVTILLIKPAFAPAIHAYTQALATANTNTRIRYIHLPHFGVPSYIFCPSGAAFLGLMLYLPDRHIQIQIESEFTMSYPDYSISSYANPVPTCVLPSALFNEHGGYTSFLNHARRFRESKGIIVNTFAELESYAMNSFSLEALPVYTVGPLVDLIGQARIQSDDRDKIMKWLDEQPPSSVIFLCFGSFGSFAPAQLVEMASGLEQSGLRFLWSIRLPPKRTPSPCQVIVWGSGDSRGDRERAVRCVMDTENVVRERVREMGEKSRKALVDGGSSFASLVCLAEDMVGNN